MTTSQLCFFLAGSILPSLLIALIATRFIRTCAPKLGLMDQPNPQRKVHTLPTPLGGGIGIWLGVVGTFAVGELMLLLALKVPAVANLVPEFARQHLSGIVNQSGNLWILLAASTVLMILGLLDDRKGLSWQVRIAFEFGVAAACVFFVKNLQLTAFMNAPLLTGLLSVLWIVGLINSFNMLDNMDGLSGGVAAISASMLAAVLLLNPDPSTHRPQLFVAGFLLVLVGAILGFLWHNKPPAKIFMGDSGAYFIGFCIAVATLLATYAGYQTPKRHAILAPVVVMGWALTTTAPLIFADHRLRAKSIVITKS